MIFVSPAPGPDSGGDWSVELASLVDAAESADGHEALSEQQRRAPASGAFVVALQARDGSGHLVGFAQAVHDNRTGWTLEAVVHPAARRDDDEAGHALVTESVAAIGRHGGGAVTLWVTDPTGAADRSASAAGLEPTRELLQMRRPLPLEPHAPPPLAVRAFRPGVDDAPWLALNNRAFAGHPEQGGWTADDLGARIAQPWFEAQGFLLHERGDQLVGWCWTKVHRTDPPLGEIYVVGVDPDLQNQGLGRALVVAGLDLLADRGLPIGMLYVDAANVSAVSLYRSLGFVVDHAGRAYSGLVDPG